jgi:transposase-like protein
MNCPKCKSNSYVKDGVVKRRQRFQCKQCAYRYTVSKLGKPPIIKKFALLLYLEGLGFRSIERLLNVSNVTVMRWVRSFGQEIEKMRKHDSDLEVVEMDEMHTYIGSKKTIVGYGLLLTDMERNSSISFLVQGEKKLEESYGKK